jgi:PAS domain S-box-containing protein
MTESGKSRTGSFLETSIPEGAVPLEAILCTEELHRRPSRPPDYEKENGALTKLVSAIADSPSTILRTLAETILDITQCDSAGLSLLTKDGKTPDVYGERFYWPAIAGIWNPHIGGGTPRNFGPCGDVLDQNRTLLFRHFENRYPYLLPVIPAAEECLLVPFYVGGKAVGTIWAIMHSDRRKFDAEDDRVMASLRKFASSAYQALVHTEDLKMQVAEREKAEAEVRKLASGLEAKVRRLVEANVVGILMFNLEGAIIGANEAFLRMVQYSREEIASGRVRWTDLTPAEWRGHNERALADVKATGILQPFEKEYFRKDGSRVPVLVGGALFDGGGNEGVAFVVDLTEQKRAEAQLAGEKRLLEMVASGCALTDVLTELCKFVEETAADCKCGVYLIDWGGPKFRIGAVPSLPATFNDPVEGLTVSAAVGPCGVAALTKTQVIATDVKSDPLWKSCAIRPLLLAHGFRSQWSTPIYSRDGHVLGTFAVFQHNPSSPTQLQLDLIAQVTHIASIAIERALNEAALKRSEVFLAEGQRLSSTGSFSWRVATDEITWSEQLYCIYEFEVGVPVTLDLIRTRVHPEDVSLLEKMKMVDQAGEGGEFEWQYRLLMPDHSIKYMHAVAHATRDQDGQLEYIAAVQDVTERRRSEEALDKARAELAHVARVMSLGTLTASIAHELNQPLSGIVTNASTCMRMLATDPPNVDGARETARRTIRDGNRASEVVARLRALFTKKQATAESVDLNDATREVIALSLSELQRSRVILRHEFADDLPVATGDRVQLQQVILNLLRNALEAMSTVDDRPRELLIRTERDEGDQVRLSVKDAGVGFTPHVADTLFEAFYTTKNDGMGIGLSISRSIIEAHHGRLWVTLNDGPGATFSFAIPSSRESVGDIEGRVTRTNPATNAA